MGKDIYDNYDEYRKMYDRASEILGIDVASLTFNSTEEELSQTQNTQIAIYTMSLAILEILKKNNISAEYLAGLSLGEYSALRYSDSFSLEDGFRIVKTRGEQMAKNIPDGSWSMAAILGLEDSKVEEICTNIDSGFVVPANYNCPGQIVISGEKEAVELAAEKAKVAGAKRTLLLKTSGPFHTIKLKNASDKFRVELEKYSITVPKRTVIKNIDACEYVASDDMVDILAKHIVSPVRFASSIKKMSDYGVDTFIEIGPGKTLSGFIKKIDPNVTVLNINNKESLESTIEYIKSNM